MASLSSPPTAVEKVTMDALQKAYEELMDSEKRAFTNTEQLVQVLEEIAHPKTSLGRAYAEINLELIVRDARHFRNTKRFRETLFRWTKEVHPHETGDLYVEMFCSGGTERLWIMGFILFYKKNIQDLLVRTGFFKDVFGAEKSTSAAQIVDRHTVLGSDDVTHIFREVEVIDVDRLCRSESFQQAALLVPKMMRSFNIAVQLCTVTSTSQHYVATVPTENSPSSVLTQQLSNRGWMHLLFVMMRAAQYMHDIRTVSQGSIAAGNATVAVLDGLPSEDTIHNMFSSISTILSNVFSNSAAGLMTALSLRFARSACITYFEPPVYVQLVQDRLAAQDVALRAATPDSLAIPTDLSYEQISTDKLWRYLAIDARAFVEKKRGFMESGIQDDWITSVLFRQLYLYRYPDGSEGAPASAKASGGNFYDRDEKETVEAAQHTHLFLYYCLVAVLRPLFHQLLVAKPPKEVATTTATTTGAETAPGAADAESAALMADHAESIAAARRAILEVARTMDTIDIQSSKTVLREWETLELGPQPRARCAIGKACFEKAVEVVLGDLMKASLVWMTQPASNWATFYAAPAKKSAKEMVPDECELTILRFLMRTEPIYHVLTDASANADGDATDGAGGGVGSSSGVAHANAMAAGVAEMQPLPDALQVCKGCFNVAVLQALEHYYPFNARYVLVVPLIDSIHSYLVDQEHRAGAGGAGPAARPPPRPGMKKMMMPPPPPPGAKMPPGGAVPRPGPAGGPAPRLRHEMVPLRSRQDLHVALRLLGCTDTDIFFQKYREMVHVRLLACPPPNRIASDEDFDAKRQATEEAPNAYMRLIVGNNADDLRTIREVCAMFKRSVDTVAGVKMVVATLPWNLWSLSEGITKASAPLTSEARAGTTNTALAPTPESPLPFPADLSRAMDTYVSQREGALTGRQLHWYGGVEGSFTTFELRYPRDAGRATTIHGTLLLEQLFLAISQYGRHGVPLDTLAHRAKLARPDLERVLNPAIHRDHLLAVREGVISLNYDFERPEANKTGVFTHWPPPTQTCPRINKEGQDKIYQERIQNGRVEVIRIMKSVRKSNFKALEETAREKLAVRFALTTRLFKDIINRLIEQKYLERGATEEELNYLA